jgi:hypothetical protein
MCFKVIFILALNGPKQIVVMLAISLVPKRSHKVLPLSEEMKVVD